MIKKYISDKRASMIRKDEFLNYRLYLIEMMFAQSIVFLQSSTQLLIRLSLLF